MPQQIVEMAKYKEIAGGAKYANNQQFLPSTDVAMSKPFVENSIAFSANDRIGYRRAPTSSIVL